MTSLCSSQEHLAARSSSHADRVPTETLYTLTALTLGSAGIVAVGLDAAAKLNADQVSSLATPTILALVGAATVAISRSLKDRGAVLSAAAALVAAATLAILLGPNPELSALGRLLGGLGFGAIAAISIERTLAAIPASRNHWAGVGVGVGVGAALGLSVGTFFNTL